MSSATTPLLPGTINIVDLFAGPGGLDVAAHWLSIPVKGIEWDIDACATRERAHLDTKAGDVRKFGPSNFSDCNVLTGGPPCQTYSVAGAGAGRRALDQVRMFVKRMTAGEDIRPSLADLDDERTGLVLEPLRWVLEAEKDGRPYEAIILEQVQTVLPVWEAYAEALELMGYHTDVDVLCTEEYGVPQTRRRAILIARRDCAPSLPVATHRRYRKGVKRHEGEAGLRPWVTMADALATSVPFEVVSNYGTGGDPKARGVRTSDEPSATVTGKISRNRVVTPSGVRRFTAREAGQLQTFPWDYPWSGRAIPQQIGNAIPPRLGVHILASALGMEDRVDEAFFKARINAEWLDSEFVNCDVLANA